MFAIGAHQHGFDEFEFAFQHGAIGIHDGSDENEQRIFEIYGRVSVLVTLIAGPLLVFGGVFFFGAVNVIDIHTDQETDDGTCWTGGCEAEDGGDDGKLKFHVGLGLQEVRQCFEAVAQHDFLNGPEGGFVVGFGPVQSSFYGFGCAIAGFHGVGFAFGDGHGVDGDGFFGLGGEFVFEDGDGGLGGDAFHILGFAVDGCGFS